MTFFTPIRLVLLFTIVALLGLIAAPRLRIDLLPQQAEAKLSIKYHTAPSSPELNENRYTSQIENCLSQLTQLRHMESSSDESSGEVILTLDPTAKLNEKRFEVSTLIRQLYPHLPTGISYPTISIASNLSKMEGEAIRVYMISGPSQRSNIQVQVSALLTKSFYELQDLKEIEIIGSPTREISILYDPVKANAFQVSLSAIETALINTFKDSYPGFIHSKGQQLFLSIAKGNTDIESLLNLPIATSANQYIRLKDVASITDKEQSITSYYRIDGQNGLNVNLYPKPGANALQLGKQIDRTARQINKQLPQGYSLKLVYDKTAYLKEELNKNYTRSALAIGILLLFILLAYRSATATIILLTSLIVNLCITVLLVAIFQININLYTISGITLAFGLMVDNAIVNLDYHRKYKDLKILPAMLGANMSIIAGLSIIYLLPTESTNFQDFASLIILSLCASLLVALGFTPAVAQLISRKEIKHKSYPQQKRSWKLFNSYQQTLNKLSVLRYLVLLFFATLFITGYYLFRTNLSETSGIRDPSQTKLYLTCNMSDGHTAAQMNAIFQTIEKYLKQQTGIGKFITYIESGQYGGIEIFIKKEYEHNSYPHQLKQELIRQCEAMEGLKWHVWGVGSFYNTGNYEKKANYSIRLMGYHYEKLLEQAQTLQNQLQENSRVAHVNINEQYDYRDRSLQKNTYISNTAKLNKYQLPVANLYQTLSRYSAETKAIAQVKIQGNYYPIYVRPAGWEERTEYDFLHHQNTADSGTAFTLAALGQLEKQPGSNKIYKKDRQYIRVVSYDYLGDANFGSKHQQLVLNQIQKELPAGFSAEKHSINLADDYHKQPRWLLLLLVSLNFVISCIIFENLRQPFLLICLIPLSFVGLFYVFGLSNIIIDQGGYAAFLMLGCLAVNAGIFLINDYNKLRQSRKIGINRALAKVFYARSRPIVLTILSCCCGLIPFLYDGETVIFWYSFSVGTLSGLLFSFISLFIFLPIMMAQRTKTKPLSC